MRNTSNKFNELLGKVKQLGLFIHDNNKGVTVITAKAQSYADQVFDGERGYILGNVIASNEQLKYVEYDVAFECVENYHKQLTSNQYHTLHQIAMKNDLERFKDYLKVNVLENDCFADMLDDVVQWQDELYGELKEIILGLCE